MIQSDNLCFLARPLPAAVWAEVDGTMVNRDSRVQRLRAAVAPPGAAQPHWQILVQAARRSGLTLGYESARAVFWAMTRECAPFARAEWGLDLPPTLLRYAGSRG